MAAIAKGGGFLNNVVKSHTTGDIAVIGKEPHAANVELLKVNKFDIEDEESCCICSSSSLSKKHIFLLLLQLLSINLL